jgi:homoserine kinase type II
MSKVYLLWHVRPGFEETGDETDSKLLGVFSSEENARAWQREASALPGFRDTPDSFHLDAVTVDHRAWPDGFITVT